MTPMMAAADNAAPHTWKETTNFHGVRSCNNEHNGANIEQVHVLVALGRRLGIKKMATCRCMAPGDSKVGAGGNNDNDARTDKRANRLYGVRDDDNLPKLNISSSPLRKFCNILGV